MPRIEKIITIFVGSPSDVSEERIILEEVIKDINHQWSKTLSTRFELLKWETDTYPNIGDYPQEVINTQIINDFDIFIGIFWTMFGTQTEYAGSGTEEEYYRVYKRYKEYHNIKICIYFKDQAVNISKIDPEQLKKINTFKTKIKDHGVFYWKFNSSDDFRKIIRNHLEKILQDTIPNNAQNNISTEAVEDNQEEHELGFFDYVNIIYENIDNLKPIIEQMTSDQYLLQNGIIKYSEKLKSIDFSSPTSRGITNRIINSLSFEISNYNNKFKASLDQLSLCTDLVFSNFHRAYLIAKTFSTDKTEQLNEIKNTIIPSIDQLISFSNTIDNVILSIKSLPPIKSNFISSQKRFIELMNILKVVIKTIKDSVNLE